MAIINGTDTGHHKRRIAIIYDVDPPQSVIGYASDQVFKYNSYSILPGYITTALSVVLSETNLETVYMSKSAEFSRRGECAMRTMDWVWKMAEHGNHILQENDPRISPEYAVFTT
jgi:hypothetical protein